MGKKKIELYLGIAIVVVMALSLTGVLGLIGITQRFVDILVIIAGIYLIVTGMNK